MLMKSYHYQVFNESFTQIKVTAVEAGLRVKAQNTKYSKKNVFL